MQRIALFLIALFLFTITDADAQRQTTYESLLRQSDQPSAYSDHVVLPQINSNSTVAVLFRLEHDFLPFLRVRPNMSAPSEEFSYFSPVRMGLEIFEGEHRSSRRETRPTGVPIFREMWSDTVWVETFEDTQSRYDHVQGVLSTQLEHGTYHYQLQLARGGSERESPSQVRPLAVHDPDSLKKADFFIVNDLDRSSNQINATFLNYGSNVLYGQNYSLLIRLPKADSDVSDDERYELSIYRVQNGEKSATADPHFTTVIDTDKYFNASESAIRKNGDDIEVELLAGEGGVLYADVLVPNVEFENASYKIELKDLEQDEVVGEKSIQSRWIDMPVSLYNLDVSIDMLKFIVDERELKNLNSGSKAERERKFREFWEERDPTPDTEFNELMTEYYERIDYAYQNFSSFQTPGYDTDRGKTYILYGPPTNIDRQLLPNQPTREIWEYPDRELIFEAVSGLGDFRLISES
ncbi:GWxTD domain-containing protein [Rhodohalobacter barkolensis]|uniref:GWxTD domain-containing protein n=1 Tax=Rhodohalobacter barkolensis TaxID=2053187 RepID=A0A2N0VJQ9_9BACT|nr:GWxTD domain-containing protein [Rhodohalobacter barkolensis]PKD44388.1 hypothetical protein CWD77_02655 [Rhodohalobacter barkolensis]